MQSKSVIRSIVAALALSFGAASVLADPVAASGTRDRDAILSQLMQSWQQRILLERLPVEDAANWSRRNLAKFSRLSAEQVDLAQSARSLGELELLLMNPPVPDGSRLGLVLASQSHNVSMLGKDNRAKSSPATAPSAYTDLVFTAVTPCRILDSRASQGGTGPWPAGSTNSIKIGPYPAAGGGYATGAGAQGGSATGCGLDTLAGPGKIAVVMVAVSTVAQAGAGYLSFFSAGAPNPGATSVSQWYQPGYVQTSFVLIPSDLLGAVSASGFSSNATEVIIDVSGYFVKAVIPPVFNGVRHTSDGFMAAGDFRDIVIPSVGTLRVDCGASAQSGAVEWRQAPGVNQQYVIAEYGSKGGTATFDAVNLSGGFGVFTAPFPDSTNNDMGRRASLQVITFGGANVITATASLQTRPSGITSSCFYAIDLLAQT